MLSMLQQEGFYLKVRPTPYIDTRISIWNMVTDLIRKVAGVASPLLFMASPVYLIPETSFPNVIWSFIFR